ncbi:MAG TPA: nucleotide exchange factor GrpE [Gemmatimonadales bacterium]|nr:nucleotide exchange factor GrpE [Gemmatimonadales bacterium]
MTDNKELDETVEDTDSPSVETAQEVDPATGGVPAEPAESAVKRLDDQYAELQERHLRLAAEFDNYRKRVARERLELAERAQASLVLKMVEILDDMDRLVAADPTGTVDSVHQAMIMVDRKLRKELEGAGLERIDPAGEPFDPTVHEAVAVTPPLEPSQAERVSATFQVGYRFKGHLVRAARVQVYSSEGGE